MGDNMFSASFEKFIPFDEFRDFTLIVSGKPYKVHRIVFAARSSAFAKIFKANQHQAVIEDISSDIFEDIAQFMYTGEVNISDKSERELLAVAERYGIKEIVNAVHLHRNLKFDPIKCKELEKLKQNYDEAKYLYSTSKDRNSIKNPFSQPPNRYY